MWTSLPSSSLRVTGTDRVDFIHGQMTGDLRRAPTPGVVPCAFLNVKGQIEFFARVYRRQGDLYLHLSAGEAEALQARLKRYIIFDQVELENVTDTLSTIHVWHEAELPGWDAAGADAQQFELAGQTVLGGRANRTGKAGVDLHYLSKDENDVKATLTGPERSLAELETARITAGIPDVSADHFQGVLPQEIGLDVGGPLPAISYRKGCYVGQEIMARLEARGNTRHHLARLQGELTPFSEVTLDGKVVGQLGAVANGLGLARLRKEIGDGQEVQAGAGTATVQRLSTNA